MTPDDRRQSEELRQVRSSRLARATDAPAANPNPGASSEGRLLAVRRWSIVFGPLFAYLALSLLLTWPLAVHFGTHVPGDGIDDPALAWNLWWVKHALVDRPQNPFACDWQFWPIGINLAFYTLTLLNGVLSIPLQMVFGVTAAYNVLLLSSFVIGGYGAYLLCREVLRCGDAETRRRGEVGGSSQVLPAFFGGLLYAFASAKLFYAALGQGNIASSQWIPFAALYLLRMARPGGRLRDVALAALFFVLQAYAELTYASFLALWAVAWGLLAILRAVLHARRDATADETHQVPGTSEVPGTWWAILRPIARFALLALLVAAGIAPILANMLPDLRAEGDFFTSGGGFADLFSADLAGYALPTQLHPLLGGAIRDLANNSAAQSDGSFWPVDKGQHIYLGYTALALALIGLWRGRRGAQTWFWAASALAFFLLTLGPSLRVAGRDLGLPLPFDLIAQLPFFKGNRYPSRYSVMLLLSVAPLVAHGFANCDLRSAIPGQPSPIENPKSKIRNPKSTFVLLGALLIFEHLSAPLPLFDLTAPALYERVAAQPADFALLELPLGWRNGARVAGKQDILIMQQLWYQTRHGKRLLGGNTSRNPEFKFQYFSEDPTLARLIATTNAADLPQHTALAAALADQPIGQADRVAARQWAAFLDIRYVMVHRHKSPPQLEMLLRDLLPVRLVAEDGAMALYELAGDLPRPQTFDVGTEAGRMILGEGWQLAPDVQRAGGVAQPAAAYGQRREVRLLLPLARSATTVRLYAWSLAPDQRMTVTLDGRVIGSRPVDQTPDWLVFDAPADPLRPLLSDVRLRLTALAPAAQVGQEPWPVGRTGVRLPASILARSAGQEVGDFGHIYVNGVDVSPNRRGYNLVALQRADAALLSAAAFDTHGDPAASGRLAAWVASLPAGAVVAGVVRDEGSFNLNHEAVAALRSLGVTTDLRGSFRWSHAFVGAVGAQSATALDAADPIRPAQVTVGLPLAEPGVGIVLQRVTIGP
jgi:hypothetical protein